MFKKNRFLFFSRPLFRLEKKESSKEPSKESVLFIKEPQKETVLKGLHWLIVCIALYYEKY